MTRTEAMSLLRAIDNQCRTQPYPPGLFLDGSGNRQDEMIDCVILWHEQNQPEVMR